MKSVLIIGMGKFGHHLCNNMLKLGNQVMIADRHEKNVEDLMNNVTSAIVADCAKEDVLNSMGVRDFDICFVCIGDDFQSNLEITCLLKDLGAKYVISLSQREIHTKFLLRNGADEVIHPEKDIAERCAIKYSNDNIFDYMELQGEFSIFEVSPIKEWIGKSLKENNIRAKYNISVIGIKNNGEMNITLSPDYIISNQDHLMIVAKKSDVDNLMKKF